MTGFKLRGITNSDAREVVRGLLKEGWTVKVTGGTHIRLTHPKGGSITTSCTGGSYQAIHLRGDIRRLERAHSEDAS